MQTVLHFLAQKTINHTLAFNTGYACKLFRNNEQVKMAFAAAIMTGMTLMQMADIFQFHVNRA